MSFEKSDLNSQEGEQNPEIAAEVREFDKKAREVAQQLDSVDPSDFTQAQIDKVDAIIEKIFDISVIIVGVALLGGSMYAKANGASADAAATAGILGAATAGVGIDRFQGARQRFKAAAGRVRGFWGE